MLNLGNRFVNNWIYEMDGAFVLIDTGYENGYSRLKKRISKYKMDAQNIRYIFLTHAHDDHAGFLNQILDEVPGAKVIASEKALPVLRRGQNSFEGGCTSRLALFFCNIMKIFGKGEHRFPPFNPDLIDRCIFVTEENRKEIEKRLGGKIMETPGHTADSISLLLQDDSLLCGDAAMNGFPSRNNITIWAEERAEYLQSWKNIIASSPEKIYPGHGIPFAAAALVKNMDKARAMPLYPLRDT